MANTNRSHDVATLALSSRDAYSFHYYGPANWSACYTMLLRRGFNEPEAIAIMRSKFTRLATDNVNTMRRFASSRDLARFLDTLTPGFDGPESTLQGYVDELVLNILGEDLITDAPVPVAKPTLRLVWSRPNA